MGAALGGGRRRGRARGLIVGINVTPLVDVVLVLLVVMMVSATYIVSQTMKVDLPNTQTSDGSHTSLAAVTILANGSMLFNGKPVRPSELRGKLRRARSKRPDVTLIVSADHASLHGAVVHVLDLARLERITSFAVQVEREAR